MANVKTKKNQFPVNLAHREFSNKYMWPGKYKAVLPPPIPDPVYPERPSEYSSSRPSTSTLRYAVCIVGTLGTDEIAQKLNHFCNCMLKMLMMEYIEL